MMSNAPHTAEQQAAQQQQAASLRPASLRQLADHLVELKQEFKDICSSVCDDQPAASNTHTNGQALLLPQVRSQAIGMKRRAA